MGDGGKSGQHIQTGECNDLVVIPEVDRCTDSTPPPLERRPARAKATAKRLAAGTAMSSCSSSRRPVRTAGTHTGSKRKNLEQHGGGKSQTPNSMKQPSVPAKRRPASASVMWDGHGTSHGTAAPVDPQMQMMPGSAVDEPALICDECFPLGTQPAAMKGWRWKCAMCPDYDLCTSCVMHTKHDKEHIFVSAIPPGGQEVPGHLLGMPNIPTAGPPCSVHAGITCHGCFGQVAGLRFKCAVCSKFDLCESCFRAGLPNDPVKLGSHDDQEHAWFLIRAPIWSPVGNMDENSQRFGSLQYDVITARTDAIISRGAPSLPPNPDGLGPPPIPSQIPIPSPALLSASWNTGGNSGAGVQHAQRSPQQQQAYLENVSPTQQTHEPCEVQDNHARNCERSAEAGTRHHSC